MGNGGVGVPVWGVYGICGHAHDQKFLQNSET